MTEQEMWDLDYAVALAIELPNLKMDSVFGVGVWTLTPQGHHFETYQPTRDPVEAMRLLVKYRLDLRYQTGGHWECEQAPQSYPAWGPTPCIAICAAVVALKGAK